MSWRDVIDVIGDAISSGVWGTSPVHDDHISDRVQVTQEALRDNFGSGTSSPDPMAGAADTLLDDVSPATSAHYYAPRTPQKLEYIDAPMAEKYKMSRSTAYQEALANTAYQRKVKDLQAAGLNPVLGISGAGAGGVYSAAAAGSGAGGYGSFGSGKTTEQSDFMKVLPWLFGAATAGLTLYGTKSAASASVAGASAKQLLQSLIYLFD